MVSIDVTSAAGESSHSPVGRRQPARRELISVVVAGKLSIKGYTIVLQRCYDRLAVMLQSQTMMVPMAGTGLILLFCPF